LVGKQRADAGGATLGSFWIAYEGLREQRTWAGERAPRTQAGQQ
jgi:hypothetical protein